MSTFIPGSWSDVRPYDVVTFRKACARSTVTRYFLAKRIRPLAAEGTVAKVADLAGEYRTKGGASHRTMNRRTWDATEYVNLASVVSVERRDARVATRSLVEEEAHEADAAFDRMYAKVEAVMPVIAERQAELDAAGAAETPQSSIEDCTHGDGCPVHPDIHGLHNLDAAAALNDVAELRDWVRGDEYLGEAGAYAALDRIERVLKGLA